MAPQPVKWAGSRWWERSVVFHNLCQKVFCTKIINFSFLPAPSILDFAHVAPSDLFLHLKQKCLNCPCTAETWLLNNSSTRLTTFCSLRHADTSNVLATVEKRMWKQCVRRGKGGDMNTDIRVFYQNSNKFCGIKTNASHVHFTTCFTVLQDLWTRYVCLFLCMPEGYCIFAVFSVLRVPVTSTNTSFRLLTIIKGVYISQHNIILSKNTATCFG